MQIITNANESVLTILKRFRKAGASYRLMKYCMEEEVEDGVLLFNLLTREMVLLNREEREGILENRSMRERWFVVPEDTNEKELVDLVRWMSNARKKPLETITRFSIFPTTDCNARCFYCFEKGCSRIHMSQETAQKVVGFVKTRSGGQKAHLAWFGGEPLFNQSAIDTICQGLAQEGVEYYSTMVSNGYLFDEETVRKAVGSWDLKNVQITLDGTEKVYNRSKAYIYQEGSPYQVVMGNIQRLLDASVSVIIRLNLDLHNAEDLLNLMDELKDRFGGRKGLHVYGYYLFDAENPQAHLHSEEGWRKRQEAMGRLEEKIRSYGMDLNRRISKHIQVDHCMADCGFGVTILPTGNIGLCDHYPDSEFIGHLDRDGFDTKMVASWQEKVEGAPDCGDCACYPSCIKLKKCTSSNICFERMKREKIQKVRQQMRCEYKCWMNNDAEDADQNPEIC